MTGFLKHYSRREEEPRHPRVVFELRDGSRLAFDCKRMFGEIDLADSASAYVVARRLGPDALAVRKDEFVERLDRRRGSVKAALMDESAIAGIGNVYSDEVLFRVRPHPETSIARLERKDLGRLYRAMPEVLRGAIRHRADPRRMPRSWLLPHRRPGGRCPRCGNVLHRIRALGVDLRAA
jgi:formamidopyrimidine-DNA glycosylase